MIMLALTGLAPGGTTILQPDDCWMPSGQDCEACTKSSMWDRSGAAGVMFGALLG